MQTASYITHLPSPLLSHPDSLSQKCPQPTLGEADLGLSLTFPHLATLWINFFSFAKLIVSATGTLGGGQNGLDLVTNSKDFSVFFPYRSSVFTGSFLSLGSSCKCHLLKENIPDQTENAHPGILHRTLCFTTL